MQIRMAMQVLSCLAFSTNKSPSKELLRWFTTLYHVCRLSTSFRHICCKLLDRRSSQYTPVITLQALELSNSLLDQQPPHPASLVSHNASRLLPQPLHSLNPESIPHPSFSSNLFKHFQNFASSSVHSSYIHNTTSSSLPHTSPFTSFQPPPI